MCQTPDKEHTREHEEQQYHREHNLVHLEDVTGVSNIIEGRARHTSREVRHKRLVYQTTVEDANDLVHLRSAACGVRVQVWGFGVWI